MALSNVALTDTFDLWRTRTNQLILVNNDLTENDFNKLTGKLFLKNTSLNADERTEVLNVSNGYISANGAGLRYLKNTSIWGVLLNSQLQNSRITLISNSSSLTVVGGGANLGNTVYININAVNRVDDTSTTNVAAASALKTAYDYTTTKFSESTSYTTTVGAVGNNYATFVGAASNSYASSIGTSANGYTNTVVYARANIALTTAQAAFAKANTNNVYITSASPSGGNDGDIWYQI